MNQCNVLHSYTINKPPLIVHLNSMIKRSEKITKFRIHFKEVYVVFDLFSKNLRERQAFLYI